MKARAASRDYRGLDRVIHERGRLAIMSMLAGGIGRMAFTEIRERLAMTDGNLSRHLAALEESGLVKMERRTGRGRPQTEVALTGEGRRAFAGYLERLEQILSQAKAATSEERAGAAAARARGREPEPEPA